MKLKQNARALMAVFNFDGSQWVVIQGFKGSKVLATFDNQAEARMMVENYNKQLAKLLGL